MGIKEWFVNFFSDVEKESREENKINATYKKKRLPKETGEKKEEKRVVGSLGWLHPWYVWFIAWFITIFIFGTFNGAWIYAKGVISFIAYCIPTSPLQVGIYFLLIWGIGSAIKNIQKNIGEKPVKWYICVLLALLTLATFGIIGGTISYFILRRRNRALASTLFWAGVVISIVILVSIFSRPFPQHPKIPPLPPLPHY